MWETIQPILQEVFELCIVPLLGLLTAYIVALIKNKIGEVQKKTDNEMAIKYLDLLGSTVANCVAATNQTYVNSLKDKNAFDLDAQKEAFTLTYNAVINSLTDEAQSYLKHVTTDVSGLVTNLIEAEIAKTK